MLDRFKFRVFDDLEKKMHDVVCLDASERVAAIVEGKYRYALDLDKDSVKLMQCTGIAVAGKESLFERDIVRDTGNDNALALIEWDEGAFHLNYIHDNVTELISGRYVEDLEIVGNIYENPELLGVE